MARVLMEPVHYISLMAIMPLGFLQIFSTYAWICFNDHKYCKPHTPSNKLENDRIMILIGFFICAVLLGIYKKMVKTPRASESDYANINDTS